MDALLKQTNELNQNNKVEDNLFVKNIIVNKEKSRKNTIPFIATERWINQLGNN